MPPGAGQAGDSGTAAPRALKPSTGEPGGLQLLLANSQVLRQSQGQRQVPACDGAGIIVLAPELIVHLLGVFSAHFQLHPQHLGQGALSSEAGILLRTRSFCCFRFAGRKTTADSQRSGNYRAPGITANPWNHSKSYRLCWKSSHKTAPQVLREIPQRQAGH